MCVLCDRARSGVVRVLSVKLALAALCNSNLSEKYQCKYLYLCWKDQDCPLEE